MTQNRDQESEFESLFEDSSIVNKSRREQKKNRDEMFW